MDMIDRRTFCAGLGAAALLQLLGPAAALAQRPAPQLVMWHAPGCGCCLEWVKRVEAAFGGRMRIVESPDLIGLKRARGVPEELWSCHTAMVGDLVVEGHVPPADIRRLIAARSRQVRGLAVQGMPLGSPGMDVGHDRREPYSVFGFGANGRSFLFARHG
jgi:hypothetical protein